RVVVRIHFWNGGQGFTSDVDLTIHSVYGTPATHYRFTIVGVRTAATTGPAYVSLSEAELKDRFVVSAYHDFGDTGRYTRPDGHVLYDYSYPDLQLTIGTDGISFG